MKEGDYQITHPCGCTEGRTTHADGMVSTGRSACEYHTMQFFAASGSGWLVDALAKKKRRDMKKKPKGKGTKGGGY